MGAFTVAESAPWLDRLVDGEAPYDGAPVRLHPGALDRLVGPRAPSDLGPAPRAATAAGPGTAPAGLADRIALVTAQVAAVLGRGAADIGADVPLATLGLDSLTALELLQRLEAATGTRLPPGAPWAGATVTELAERLGGPPG
jgi:acyl carrier protein